MKRKITLSCLLLLFTVFSFAQHRHDGGHLTIFSESGEKFFLILNGEQLNDMPRANIRLEGISEPSLNVQIVFANRNLRPIVKDFLAITDADGIFRDVTYKIRKEKGKKAKMKLSFVSMVPVRENYTTPNSVYVLHFPHIQITPGPDPMPNDPYQQQPIGCKSNYPMKATDFNSALATVKKQGFDDTRLKIAQQILSANCMNTDQIIQIANTFGFDANKLDFAKFAYEFCTDPGNYFKVSNVFGFSSSAEELSDYVQSRN